MRPCAIIYPWVFGGVWLALKLLVDGTTIFYATTVTPPPLQLEPFSDMINSLREREGYNCSLILFSIWWRERKKEKTSGEEAKKGATQNSIKSFPIPRDEPFLLYHSFLMAFFFLFFFFFLCMHYLLYVLYPFCTFIRRHLSLFFFPFYHFFLDDFLYCYKSLSMNSNSPTYTHKL